MADGQSVTLVLEFPLGEDITGPDALKAAVEERLTKAPFNLDVARQETRIIARSEAGELVFKNRDGECGFTPYSSDPPPLPPPEDLGVEYIWESDTRLPEPDEPLD